MHGEGTLYQKDGSYYKGTFASGQMSGHGKQVTVVDGKETEIFEGSFLRGQRHNEGLDHRVGRSDTRLWYNHGRLLRRQVSSRQLARCSSTGTHPLSQVLCRLPHHHALIVTVSTSSRASQPPGAGLRYSAFAASENHAPLSHCPAAGCPPPSSKPRSRATPPPATPRNTCAVSRTTRPPPRTSAKRSQTSARRRAWAAACWWCSTCRRWRYRAARRPGSTFVRMITGEQRRRIPRLSSSFCTDIPLRVLASCNLTAWQQRRPSRLRLAH
jgi:hypothetical protein